jgi:co-chaperonin GroES (HSP10)
MKLIGNRVLITLTKKEDVTASGFVLPNESKGPDSLQVGVVSFVGSGTLNDAGVLKPVSSDIVAGASVLFYYGTSVTIEGKPYLLVNEADIIMVN